VTEHAQEVSRGDRFEFGANWVHFLSVLNEDRIGQAESLREMLGVSHLEGKRFLDTGSSSGLFSLAARRLGAAIRSSYYDPESVGCTQELKRRYFAGDSQWLIQEGFGVGSELPGPSRAVLMWCIAGVSCITPAQGGSFGQCGSFGCRWWEVRAGSVDGHRSMGDAKVTV
jgi:hypothetical protein